MGWQVLIHCEAGISESEAGKSGKGERVKPRTYHFCRNATTGGKQTRR
jgi:hypothetical protein